MCKPDPRASKVAGIFNGLARERCLSQNYWLSMQLNDWKMSLRSGRAMLVDIERELVPRQESKIGL